MLSTNQQNALLHIRELLLSADQQATFALEASVAGNAPQQSFHRERFDVLVLDAIFEAKHVDDRPDEEKLPLPEPEPERQQQSSPSQQNV